MRTATLVAVEPSKVLVISKDPFMKTVGEEMKNVNSTRIEMFHKIPLFANWNLAQLASLLKHFQRMDLVYNASVYAKEYKDDSIYIVLKGEVDVIIL